MNVPR
jgi:hypothetical protein